MLDFLVDLLSPFIGGIGDLRDGRDERQSRKRARTTKIVCALRVVDGVHPGLGRRWTRGAARVPAGVVTFEPDSHWKSRLAVPVRSVALEVAGRVPRRVRRALGPDPCLIVLVSTGATVEWLVPEAQLQRAMSVVTRTGTW